MADGSGRPQGALSGNTAMPLIGLAAGDDEYWTNPGKASRTCAAVRIFSELGTRRVAPSMSRPVSRAIWAKQPVRTTCASGFCRAALRAVCRDFLSASAVTEHVLTT